jgi:hypothetical protein
MGNKKNRVKKRKAHMRGQFFAEWRVLKSYGLDKVSTSSEKLKIITQEEKSEVNSQSSVNYDHAERTTTPGLPVQDEVGDTDATPGLPVQDKVGDIEVTAGCSSAVTPENILSGRRIVEVKWFLNEIKAMNEHNHAFGCTFSNMIYQSEICRGLRSGFNFKCNMCNFRYTLWSEPEISERMDVNSAAVAAVMGSGGGYSSLQQVMAGMDVRCMSENTYSSYHAMVSEGWEATAMDEMRAAAEEEAMLARQRGDVDSQGVPLITVVADASWAKRSYRTNFSSLSGVVRKFYKCVLEFFVILPLCKMFCFLPQSPQMIRFLHICHEVKRKWFHKVNFWGTELCSE